MKTENYTVYKLTLSDGRVYIGMTQQSLSQRCRKSAYNGCPAMAKAIEEHGWDAFSLSVISDHLSQEDAEEIEKYNIALYDSTNPHKGFNVALGGNIVGRHSVDTRKRMSISQKGRLFSKEHLSKLKKPKLNGALRRTVIQYDKDGKRLCEFPSLNDAAKSVDGCKECISRCCNHKQHSHKGFKWEYGERGCSHDKC